MSGASQPSEIIFLLICRAQPVLIVTDHDAGASTVVWKFALFATISSAQPSIIFKFLQHSTPQSRKEVTMMERLPFISRVIYLQGPICSSCARRLALSSASKKGRTLVQRHHLTTPRRHFSYSPRRRRPEPESVSKGNDGQSQAYPLTGYYSEILTTPSPAVHHARETSGTDEQSSADKLSIVFGTRLAGPGYSSTRYEPATTSPESTWRRVNGVAIPPRPAEPDNCCMSGCVHCVWDDYRDEVESWAARLQEAKNRQPQKGRTKTHSLIGRDMKQQGAEARQEVASASLSMDDDGGGSEANWDSSASSLGDELFSNIPVGIREFMKTEKRLKEKRLRQQGRT